MIGIIDISVFLAMTLIHVTDHAKSAAVSQEQGEHLSAVSYVILGVVLMALICGLSWCFYRAIIAANRGAPEQVQQ